MAAHTKAPFSESIVIKMPPRGKFSFMQYTKRSTVNRHQHKMTTWNPLDTHKEKYDDRRTEPCKE